MPKTDVSGSCGEKAGEVVELVAVEIGHEPEAHAAAREALDIETVARQRLLRLLFRGGPDEYVDHVLAAPVDEHRDGLPADVILSAAQQLESVGREVGDRRRKSEPCAQPPVHSVLIRGGDIEQAVSERRA